MKHRDSYRAHEVRIRSSLDRVTGNSPADAGEVREKAARAWKEGRALVIFPDQVTNWRDRALLDLIGNRLYGRQEKSPGANRG